MKKTIAAILSLTMALTMLAGCGDNDSSSKNTANSSSANTDAGSSADNGSKADTKGTVVEEPDFLGGLIEGKTEFYGMSYEDFSKAGDGKYTKENAMEVIEEDGSLFMRFALGSKDNFAGGRVKLDKAYEMVCKVSFKDNALKRGSVRIENISKEEAKTICDKFMADLKENLPEGYKKARASEFGKRFEDGYCKSERDMIYSIKRDEDFDGNYYVEFIYDNYAERYDIDHPQKLS